MKAGKKQAVPTQNEKNVRQALTLFEPKTNITAGGLMDLLPEIPRSSLQAQLGKLAETGELIRVLHGVYQIPETKIPAQVPVPTNKVVPVVSNLSIEELEEVLQWLIEDYIRAKRDVLDMRNMLERVFGSLKKAKIVSLHNGQINK